MRESFRCPFHGFTWNLDGSMRNAPCRHDFAHVTDDDWRLPEGAPRPGGFVFINMDPDAPPLEEYLEVLPEHFARWRLEDCWKSAHVAKVIDCNWKPAQEAFMNLPCDRDAPADPRRDRGFEFAVRPYGDHVNRNLTAFCGAEPAPRTGWSATHHATRACWRDVASRRCGRAVPRFPAAKSRAVLGGLNAARSSAPGAATGRRHRRGDAGRDGLQRSPNFSPWADSRRTSSIAGGRTDSTSAAA